jgi:lipoprotein NlpD
VKRGDTVQKIALDHGLDYRELAAWNNLENINVIRAGQVLRLTAPPTESASVAASAVQTAPLKTVPALTAGDASPAPASLSGTRTNTETYKSQPKAFKEPYSEQALRDAQRGGTATASSPCRQSQSRRSSLRVRIPNPPRSRPRPLPASIPNLRRSRRMAMKRSIGCGQPKARS